VHGTISKKQLYVCDKTGNIHVCGKTFCDSAIGRRSQWTCDITQNNFPPNMCVYQNDFFRQCVVVGDDHNPAFLHTAAFDPQQELDQQLQTFRRDYPDPTADARTATSTGPPRWTAAMPSKQDIAHFDFLFGVPATTEQQEQEQKEQRQTESMLDTPLEEQEPKRVSTQKVVGIKRKKKITRVVDTAPAAAAARKPTTPAGVSAVVPPIVMQDSPIADEDNDWDESKQPSPTSNPPNKRPKLASTEPLREPTTLAPTPPTTTTTAKSKVKKAGTGTAKKEAIRHTPFRFPDMHTTEPCAEYAQEALHRIVHASTHRKLGRHKLRSVSLFRQELLRIDSNEHTHLLQLAVQCWNSWTFIVPLLTQTPALAQNWLPVYTLDIHCLLMLMACKETDVQSFHWLGENNPMHPQLSHVIPNKKQLHELGITHARLQMAMHCMHDVSLYSQG
jgi:hypothetical protein